MGSGNFGSYPMKETNISADHYIYYMIPKWGWILDGLTLVAQV